MKIMIWDLYSSSFFFLFLKFLLFFFFNIVSAIIDYGTSIFFYFIFLREILPLIISNAQSAFVPRRFICDIVFVDFEVIHYMKRKMKGKKGKVALKIDISKAYDRIN